MPEDWEVPRDVSFISQECSGTLHEIANVWAILNQISEGLAYIHKQSLVHGDMKPANGDHLW